MTQMEERLLNQVEGSKNVLENIKASEMMIASLNKSKEMEKDVIKKLYETMDEKGSPNYKTTQEMENATRELIDFRSKIVEMFSNEIAKIEEDVKLLNEAHQMVNN
jgi:type VI protein secretion system component VasK